MSQASNRSGRRLATGVAVFAIAAAGAAWTGCGGDDEDEARDEVEEAFDENADELEAAAAEGEEEAQENIDQLNQGLEELDTTVPEP